MSKSKVLKIEYGDHSCETIAGVDEAGAGALMGPVAAAAVIWSSKGDVTDIRDSKRITSETKRNALADRIKTNAFDYAVEFIDEDTIDEINILESRIQAMHNSLSELSNPFEIVLVDGNRFHPFTLKRGFERGKEIPHNLIIRGDDEYIAIAAASILAKTERDKFIRQLHEEYPLYGWDRNKGYGTKEHISAIRKYGVTPYHRKTFVTKFI